MKQVLQRLDQLERKIESEVGGLRADVLSRLAELEMRVTTSFAGRSPLQSATARRTAPHRLARDERIEPLVKRVEAVEATLG
jgi:hypothetical protein